jgi:diguanylate cyclase (GGDEF)-like protein/PAS domain S-box-containing protein
MPTRAPVPADRVWALLAGTPPPSPPIFVLEVRSARKTPRFRYVAANDAYRTHLGLFAGAEAVVGRSPEELLPEKFVGDALERYERVADRGTPVRYDTGFEFQDGTATYEVTLEPIADSAGRCRQILGVARLRPDVDEDTVLHATERRFAALVEHSSDMVVVLDATGRIVYGSTSVSRVLGWPSGLYPTEDDPMDAISAFELVHPDDRDRIEGLFEAGVANGELERRAELRLRRVDGSWCWVEAVGTNRLDDPAVEGVVVNARDISERRAAETALRVSEDRFRSLAQHASEFVTVYGPDDLITYASPAVGRFIGCAPEELIGTRRTDVVHPDDRAGFLAGMAHIRSIPGHSGWLTARLLRGDGAYRWLEATATNLLDNPNVEGIVVNARDVTERLHAEWALRDSEERFRSAFEHAPIGMALADDTGRLLRTNAAFAAMLGRTPEALAEMTIREITHADDWSENDENMTRLFSGELSGYRMEKRYVHADGHLVWVALSVSAVRDAAGEPLYMIGQVEDITERKAIGERLVHQAIHDPLTGLPNRTLFIDRLREVMTRSARRRDRIAVLFLDLDYFKVINDSLGHEAGDQVLVTIGHRLRRMLRPSDTVARFGGDEFTILCPATPDADSVMSLAERVLEEVERPVLLSEGEIFVTASIGIACSDHREETPETLVRDADAAMYRAKELGRRRAEFFDERARVRNLEHLHTGNALHRALERGEFELHYQPIFELETGRVSGFEALVRWQHPDRGLIGPVEFIGLAEETGLIVPLGIWVVDTACRQLAVWQAAKGDTRRLTMSANLSPRQLAEPSLPGQVSEILDRTGIRQGSLWLEITETALMQDTDSASSALRALQALGIHLAVDDFGTGYSSLSHLKRFPIEALKIDCSFVDGLAYDPEDAAIVTAVVSLAHALGLSSTAEGVETPEQLAELLTLGCEHAQGNLFAEPRPADELTDDPVGLLGHWARLADGSSA